MSRGEGPFSKIRFLRSGRRDYQKIPILYDIVYGCPLTLIWSHANMHGYFGLLNFRELLLHSVFVVEVLSLNTKEGRLAKSSASDKFIRIQ